MKGTKKLHAHAVATHFECNHCGGACDGPHGHEICDRFGKGATPCYCDISNADTEEDKHVSE
jgi:hypothetical protein